jgi:hypothetical protein
MFEKLFPLHKKMYSCNTCICVHVPCVRAQITKVAGGRVRLIRDMRSYTFLAAAFSAPENRRNFFIEYALSHKFDHNVPENWYNQSFSTVMATEVCPPSILTTSRVIFLYIKKLTDYLKIGSIKGYVIPRW